MSIARLDSVASSNHTTNSVQVVPHDGQHVSWTADVNGLTVAPRASVERLMTVELERRFGSGADVKVRLSDPHSINAWSDTEHFARVFGEVSVAGRYAGTILVNATGPQPRLYGFDAPAGSRPERTESFSKPVEVAPGTWYRPVSAADRFIVENNPAARQLIAGATAAKLGVAGTQQAP